MKPTLSNCRVSGLLLHPTSFPGPFGVGDLGPSAQRFIDFLADTGQRLWQVLPLGPTGYGNSPYMCYSAMAGNPLLISLERLQEKGHLEEADLANPPEFPSDRANYDWAAHYKYPLLQKACEHFRQFATPEETEAFEKFQASKHYWLGDYALFMALKVDQEGESWHRWPAELAKRKPEALEEARSRLAESVFLQIYLQFEFAQQWTDLKTYANDKNVYIIGDIPIYVAHDSADVWARPENFSLDVRTGEPASMAGVPPDYFSATGQLWGNPTYNWGRLKKTKFDWWIQRFRALQDYVDYIRIDHFRGFEGFWSVPKGETTAMKGRWVKAPGEEFFETLRQELGELPILAEDLGIITPEVEALRDRFEFPGMKVLHFAFGSDPGNSFLPFNYVRNCVVYTGTHDNDTTRGWLETLSDHERWYLKTYIGEPDPEDIHWALLRLALTSQANVAIAPMQDLWGLGTEARMNFPGKAEGNWEWRYEADWLTPEVGEKLRNLTWASGRSPT